jgi:serine/threonine-protein kinase
MNPLSIMRQMAAGLNYVHLAGYLHLDFKPENIVVRNDGLVVLIDFDLATERKPKPIKLSPLPGTFSFLPPETINKGLVDDQTDIYSFGATCFEMLTGHKPFEGITVEDARRQQLDPRVSPRPLRLFHVQVPPAVERVIFKCLAHHQHDRYPSMSLVQRDLETMV